MKLVRYGRPGNEKPGLVDAEGTLRDLSAIVPDIGPAQLSPASLARSKGSGQGAAGAWHAAQGLSCRIRRKDRRDRLELHGPRR